MVCLFNEFCTQRIFERLLDADIETPEDKNSAKHPDTRGQRNDENRHSRCQCVACSENEVLAETVGKPTSDKGKSSIEDIVQNV
jgi:hypothetical protein